MKTNFLKLAVIAVLITVQPLVASAQDAPKQQDWAAVQSVSPGDELIVEMKDGKRVRAKLSAASDSTLTLDHKNKSLSLDRTGVQKIYLQYKGSRAKSSLIGTGFGAGIGLGLAFAALAATGGSDETGDILLGGVAIGAGIGAGLGALLGKDGKRTLIYQSR